MRKGRAIQSYFQCRLTPFWTPAVIVLLVAGFLCFSGPLQRARAADEPLDSWTTARAKIAIATSQAGVVKDVWVDVVRGTVTLAGKMPLATDISEVVAAVKAVEGVREVRSLVERADYAPPQVDDSKIAEQVKAMLGEGPFRLEGVKEGIVQIAGNAPSLLAQVGAFQKVLQIEGVRGIRSSVKPAGELYTKETREKWLTLARKGEAMPGPYQDFWITGAVKLRLAGHPNVPARSINVDTRNAVVMLFGVVANEDARKVAGRQAEVIDRVERVENEIQVDPGIAPAVSKANDPEIEAEVKEALKNYSPLDSMDVTVSVKDGVATLRGSAKTDEQAVAATVLARSIDGIRAVRNELVVER